MLVHTLFAFPDTGPMTPATPLFLGLDVGTQSVRAALFDLMGTCRAFATSPLDTFHPYPGWAEQDANQWWPAARSAVPVALANARASAADVAGIGLDCTACTVLPCRTDGTPLRRALLWMDQRAFREAEEISATRDPSLRFVSGVVSPEWMLPKALWLKRHEAAVYDRTERLIECTDWFMYRLTGDWTLSLNHVTVKWNYARPDGGWSRALLRQVGLEDLAAKWPATVVPLGRGEAQLSASAAAELGLRPGTPVAQGGIDAYLGMLGLGAVGRGDLAMIMGSSTCHLAMAAQALFDSGMLGCYPDAVVEGLYTLEGGQTATGSILNWYRQHFAGHESAEAERTGRPVYEILDAKAAAVPPGCEGLVCLDYWQGNRCPLKDPRARGTFWGLTLSHGPGHLFRSIYEATAFGTRHILDDLRQHGFAVERLFAGGGGARSRLWVQIHADVLGQPIHLPRESEACALGSALVAAVHAGHYPDLSEAARHMVQMAAVVEPYQENKRVYDRYYAKYLATYPALRDLMHEMANAGRPPGGPAAY
jgi:FGGY-family pentulose kinase